MTRCRRSTWSPLSLILASIVALSHPFAAAQTYPINDRGCDTRSPLDPWTPPEYPVYAELCGPGGPGSSCPSAGPPTVLSMDSQEAVLSTIVPAGYYASGVWWRALGGPGMQQLWMHGSTEGLPPGGYPPGTIIDFGAPGLVPGSPHEFQVAFCDPLLCLCWSAPSAPVPTDSLDNLGPTPPATLSTTMEDHFDRPDTTGKCDGGHGDGLGPGQVWDDRCDDVSATSSPRIVDHSGYFLPSSFAEYTALVPSRSHTFADTKVRVDLTNTNASKYNFQVVARVVQPTTSGFSGRLYAAKLILGPRHCAEPTLFAVWFAENPSNPWNEYNKASCLPEDATHSRPYDPSVAVECNAAGFTPPLDVEDPAHPGRSKPVWLRIEVEDGSAQQRNVIVRATVAWDCPDGQPISQCAHVCSVTRNDTDDTHHQMFDQIGRWGMGFHEKHYYVDYFKAGQAP